MLEQEQSPSLMLLQTQLKREVHMVNGLGQIILDLVLVEIAVSRGALARLKMAHTLEW